MKRFARISPLTVTLAAVLIAGIAIAATPALRVNGLRFGAHDTSVYVTAYGATGDGTTDDQAAIAAAFAAVSPSGTVYFPAGTYKVGGGFIVNKPVRIIGAGKATTIRMTGTATSSVLFYLGGAIPNGTPRPGFSAGTSFTFAGALTSGQTTITGIGSTAGLSVGDDIFLSLGQDPNDACQYAFRMWNRINALTSTTVTLEIPLPEAVSGTFSGGCVSPGNITTHTIYKYTTNPDGFEVGNLAIQQTSGPSYDVTIFAERARNIYVHDIFLTDAYQVAGAGASIVIGESENATAERIYGDHAGGINVYGSRGVAARDFFLRQVPASAVYLESQNRGFHADNFVIESGLEHTTQQIIFDDGNSKNVHLSNFTFNTLNNGNFLTFALGTLTNKNDVVTENFEFYGPIGQVLSFPLQQHRGILMLNGTVYRDTKKIYQVIPLLASQGGGAVVTLAKGLIKNMKVLASTTTGLTAVRFRDETSLQEQTLYDPGNSINLLPGGAAGTFGYPTSSVLWTAGNSYPFNISPNMKSVHYYTDGTLPAGSSLTVDIDMYVPEDDGANGSGVNNAFPSGIVASSMDTQTVTGMTLCGSTCNGITIGRTGVSVTVPQTLAATTVAAGAGGVDSNGAIALGFGAGNATEIDIGHGTIATKVTGNLQSVGTTFASLGTPSNGTLIYCSNCTIANPCASGGTGAIAKRLNGVWVCN